MVSIIVPVYNVEKYLVRCFMYFINFIRKTFNIIILL